MSVWYETNQLMLFYLDHNKHLYLHSRLLDHSRGKKVRRKSKMCKESAAMLCFFLDLKDYLSSTEMAQNEKKNYKRQFFPH